MKRNIIKKLSISLAVITAVLAVGCGGSSYNKSANYESATESYAGSDGLYNDEAVEYYDEAEAPGSASNGATEITEESAESNKSTRKLITNISVDVETQEFDALVKFIKEKTEQLGGYIESENINNNSYNSRSERYGSLTLRIPEAKLDGFMSSVDEKSHIKSQNRSVKDVTLTYADLEGHKKALLKEQDQLLTLMEKAESVEDIITIQDKLTDVQYQLESMESQLRTFDNQVSYSTVEMSIDEVIEYTPDAPKTFWEKAGEGFVENFAAVVAFFEALLLAIITHIPTLIVLIVILIIVIIIVKICDKKAKKKRAEKMAKNPMMYQNMQPQQTQQSQPVFTQQPEVKNNSTEDKK
ncbi:DUF4349 domain-containing protein [Butyrivibrio sp. WCD3002]|uniref:DUF4349 domain-containing protein n=1 Tax=Butyrivibrio sp. WCD3002 TaxID=1280676 RepID=UPI0003F5D286|nr:DUF4349 domain-containing protein [Butyrivibrio sp. WCD3002]